MPSVQASRTIDAPLAQVWAVFTDLPAIPQRLRAVERVELVTDQPFAVGTTWLETRKMFGRIATEEMQVTAVDPLVGYTVAATGVGAIYVSRFDFDAVTTTTTKVRLTFTGETERGGARQAIGRLVWPLMQGRVARELYRDLDDLAAVCEQVG